MSRAQNKSNWMRAAFAEKVVMQPVARLRPLGRKTRRHGKAQISSLKESIRHFGWVAPILIDEDERIIAGLARVEAAKELGLEEAPCLVISHLNELEKRAYAIADNRLGEDADWDDEVLAEEFAELRASDLEEDMLLATGFSGAFIENLIDDQLEPAASPEPEKPEAPTSRLGDIWQCGDHVVGCLDATKTSSVELLASGETFAAVVEDCPFNLPIRGVVSSKSSHREFVMGSGEMSDARFTDFLTDAYGVAVSALREGGLLYAAMDWRHMSHILEAAKRLNLMLLNLCVWTKPAAGQGAFYRSQHELFFVFLKPGASHNNRVKLGINGRSRSNVWRYEGVVGGGRKSKAAHQEHPSPKPPPLILDILKDCTEPGEIVFDGFGGGGSLLVACEQSGRRGRLMDLDPGYVDVMVQRWQRLSGCEATLRGDGRTFAAVSVARKANIEPAPPVVRMRTRKPAGEG